MAADINNKVKGYNAHYHHCIAEDNGDTIIIKCKVSKLSHLKYALDFVYTNKPIGYDHFIIPADIFIKKHNSLGVFYDKEQDYFDNYKEHDLEFPEEIFQFKYIRHI